MQLRGMSKHIRVQEEKRPERMETMHIHRILRAKGLMILLISQPSMPKACKPRVSGQILKPKD